MRATKTVNHNIVLGTLLGLMLCPLVVARQPATQPTTTRSRTADQQRFEELLALIEGTNLPLSVRLTGAKELLRQDWPQRVERLSAILAGTNTPAQTAVALALADVPAARVEAYINPLMKMLAAPEVEVHLAAAMALACYRNNGVIPRLRQVMLDGAAPLSSRLAAIEALGMMSQRAAAAALVEALQEKSTPICQPALQALERATALSFGEDVVQARNWWERSQGLPPLEWQQQHIERLMRQNRATDRRLWELEGRLVEAFREDYIHAAEPARGTLLQGYLMDDSALVRLLGLELILRQLGEGKELPAETAGHTRTQVRALLSDREFTVRAKAVQAVARFRQANDADRFVELLATESHLTVRRALVNGLGYIGSYAVVPALLAILQTPEAPCQTEAVAALGRLAERGELNEQIHGSIANALLTTFNHTQPTQVVLREQTLWTMSLVTDPRFGGIFTATLADTEAATVRQTAIRGIAALGDARLLSTLVPLLQDADLTIRKTAAEALAESGTTDDHLAALWERLDPSRESDESVRHIAWRGVRRILSQRPLAETESWISHLPANGTELDKRTLELLEMMEKSLANLPDAHAKLGQIQRNIASRRAALGQTDQAIAAYLTALRSLHTVQSTAVSSVAVELLCLALPAGCYDEAMASKLANGNPPLDGVVIWNGIKGIIEQCLTREQADRAMAMLKALQAHPPATFPPEVIQAIEALVERARALQSPTPSTAPTSQPKRLQTH